MVNGKCHENSRRATTMDNEKDGDVLLDGAASALGGGECECENPCWSFRLTRMVLYFSERADPSRRSVFFQSGLSS